MARVVNGDVGTLHVVLLAMPMEQTLLLMSVLHTVGFQVSRDAHHGRDAGDALHRACFLDELSFAVLFVVSQC